MQKDYTGKNVRNREIGFQKENEAAFDNKKREEIKKRGLGIGKREGLFLKEMILLLIFLQTLYIRTRYESVSSMIKRLFFKTHGNKKTLISIIGLCDFDFPHSLKDCIYVVKTT